MFNAGFEFAAGAFLFIAGVFLIHELFKFWQIILTIVITFVIPFIITFIILLTVWPNSGLLILILIPLAVSFEIAKKFFMKIYDKLPSENEE